MPPTSPTSRSTLPLSEVARHVKFPPDIVTSAYPMVEQRCREMGIRFDGWQKGVARLALGKRSDGKYASTVGGVVLSIPRQVGKTFLVGAIVFALCSLIPGLTVLWTAHRTRTSTQTFRSLSAMARRKKIARFIKSIRSANGEQEIAFTNGSVIMFGAREQGFGRGFDSVDIEVFDEAQILSEKALEDMVPAANASKQPTGALLFFMGTPPRPIDPGEEFTNRRRKALEGNLRGVYVEFSSDEDASPNDFEQIAKANPSYPDRTPLESIERMREQLTDDESFMREAMGIWSAKSTRHVIDPDVWRDPEIANPASKIAVDSEVAYAVDMNPERTMTVIAVAGFAAEGIPQVEVVKRAQGDPVWVAAWLEERLKRGRKCRAVVIDVASPAKSLTDQRRDGKWILKDAPTVFVTAPRVSDVADACGQFVDAVAAKRIRHLDSPGLNKSLEVARKRAIRDAGQWAWDRKSQDSDITPIVAVTNALWGLTSNNVEKPYRSGGRAVSRATRRPHA